MTQFYFGGWYNEVTPTHLDALKQALSQQDKAKVETLSEALFESYLDVTAALTKAQVIQYADLMGDELSAIELDICMGELVDHHHPNDIETACRHCLELGIGFPFADYFLMEMTANRSEFDIEFFERTVAPSFVELRKAGKMSVTDYFALMCEIICRLDKCEYGANCLEKLLKDPELDLSQLTENDYTACLDTCHYGYFLKPELFRLFVKKANGRQVTESTTEWQESGEYFLITYQFKSIFGEANAYCGGWEEYKDSFTDAFIELKRSNLVTQVEQQVIDCLERDGHHDLAQAFITA
ncbi:hypothetical protein L3V43_13285 [Pseudoalteromonas sp. L23]|nr:MULTISPECIES: hypothetical protein [unclassified Pseudoalteromonas]MCF7514597.1 hypothetical protein [Pseudoalteromonas sp. L7]MCF7526624.1 hypothetical protein [Pseudoalteromonas sp. L23]MCX2766334.1 hypothetical protein [Pseudoalteromonas sp. B530]